MMTVNLLKKTHVNCHCTFAQITLIRKITTQSRHCMKPSVCALTGGSGVRKAALLLLHDMQWLSSRT